MLGALEQLAGASGGAAVARDPAPGRRDDLQVQLAEAGANRDGLADVAGRDAVAVALQGDHRGARDDPLGLELRRECRRRQDRQRLVGGELGDRGPAPFAPIGDRERPAVQIGLGRAERRDGRGAPPRACEVLDGGLDDALSLRTPRRADPHLDAVVLGDLRERRRQPIGARNHDRRHPIGPPRAAGAAQAAQDAVDRIDQVREAHALADHRATAARATARRRARRPARPTASRSARASRTGSPRQAPGPARPAPHARRSGTPRSAGATPAAAAHARTSHTSARTRAPRPRGRAPSRRHARHRQTARPSTHETGPRQLGPGSRAGRGPVRYLRTVLRSRPVCRAIADTDQPRRASAWISTSSSSLSIPPGASIQIAGVRHPRPRRGPPTDRASGYPLRSALRAFAARAAAATRSQRGEFP